jgi:aldose 1-epimerase
VEYEIKAGDYAATITARGAALRQLQHLGRDLTVPFPTGSPIPDYRGIIAAPWPNRIRDGKYEFHGVDYQIPINEPEHDCAVHGFAFDLDWTIEEHDDSSVCLTCTIRATPGYPFTLRLSARYRLDRGGLHTSITATNIGDKTAPYGVCPHPVPSSGPSSTG